MQEEFETKPFLAHLEDLRWMIIRCVAALAVGVTICAFLARPLILPVLYGPLRAAGRDPKDFLLALGVTDPLTMHIEISVFGGLMLALPFLLYYVAQFLLPALTDKEKKFMAPVFAIGAVMFLIGVVFCYFIVLEPALLFFIQYNNYFGIEAHWTAKGFVDFEVQMLLGFGLAFEFPLILIVLNLFGLVSSQLLASKRRHAAFFIFVATCCIIPTTDPFSLSLLAVPLYVLYEACIWVARAFERRKAKALA